MYCNWKRIESDYVCEVCGTVSSHKPLRACGKTQPVASHANVIREQPGPPPIHTGPREKVLEYLRLHPDSSIGEIVSSCSGCKDRLYDALRNLVADGLVSKIGDSPPVYSVVSGQF